MELVKESTLLLDLINKLTLNQPTSWHEFYNAVTSMRSKSCARARDEQVA